MDTVFPSMQGFPGAELAVLSMAFAWGATLGSFANVVVHRWPRGESVASGSSRCPRCGTAILPRDNIPVVGWLVLHGRCRACAAGISPRYPVVEATCGLIATLIAASVLIGQGSLPTGTGRPGIDRLLAGDWQPAVCWGIHTLISIAMLTWGLIAFDAALHEGATGQPTTARTLASGSACPGAAGIALLVLLAVAAYPSIGPEPLRPDDVGQTTFPSWAGPFVASCIGMALGRVVGGFSRGATDACGFALMGAVGGWQVVLIGAVVTMLARQLVGWINPTFMRRVAADALTPALTAPLLFAAAPAFPSILRSLGRLVMVGAIFVREPGHVISRLPGCIVQ